MKSTLTLNIIAMCALSSHAVNLKAFVGAFVTAYAARPQHASSHQDPDLRESAKELRKSVRELKQEINNHKSIHLDPGFYKNNFDKCEVSLAEIVDGICVDVKCKEDMMSNFKPTSDETITSRTFLKKMLNALWLALPQVQQEKITDVTLGGCEGFIGSIKSGYSVRLTESARKLRKKAQKLKKEINNHRLIHLDPEFYKNNFDKCEGSLAEIVARVCVDSKCEKSMMDNLKTPNGEPITSPPFLKKMLDALQVVLQQVQNKIPDATLGGCEGFINEIEAGYRSHSQD